MLADSTNRTFRSDGCYETATPSLERAGSLSCPTLVIPGDRDSIRPAEQSKQLYAGITAKKRLLEVSDADHNDDALFPDWS